MPRPERTPHPGSAVPPARQDPLAIACCGALAFVLSSVAHEVVGHGGTALLTGARIARISSVYFEALDAKPIVDAGGPLMNLIVSGLLLLWCRCRRATSPYGRMLVCALAALNLFWGFGYFLFSGISGQGDWAFLFSRSGSPWVWRAALIAVGYYGYRRSITIVGALMAPFARDTGGRSPARPLLQPAILLYLSAGATCCFAALFYRGPVGLALRDSAVESFAAFVGLCFVAPRRPEGSGPGVLGIERDWRWTAASIAVVALYVGVLGRGYLG